MLINFLDPQVHTNAAELESEYRLTKVKFFDRQKMLREIFPWSVYAGYADIAFVILLHIESRMSAALVATSMARRLSKFTNSIDAHYKFDQQAKDYESYATACITACYNHNKRRTCQILLRENPFFGNITCMQVSPVEFNNRFIVLVLSYRLRLHHVVCNLSIQMLVMKF